jgi:hypothetical protein
MNSKKATKLDLYIQGFLSQKIYKTLTNCSESVWGSYEGCRIKRLFKT